MPIYNPRLTSINIAEAKRYAGLHKCGEFPYKMLENACDNALVLAQPQGSWECYPYLSDMATILAPAPLLLRANSIQKHLRGATQVIVMAATIGAVIEQSIAEHFTQGSYTAGLLLDAAATAAVETVADKVEAVIVQEAAKMGYATLPRFSPGYGDWNIIVQQEIVALAHGGAINIKTNEASMLIPRKSVTAVIGWVATDKNAGRQSLCGNMSCSSCSKQSCYARKES